ncbi:MAG: DedA family protein [Gemmatimonadaceae bacterium]
MDSFLGWLESLPPVALYAALALTAAAENIFPPLPADTVVAFGSFLAARGAATPVGAFLATWTGNIAGAMMMYAVGRRYGAERLQRGFKWFGGEKGQARLRSLYESRGMLALFISRFLPALRALVPPFAGALRIPPLRAAIVMGVASGLWYGAITWLAYRVGSDWDTLRARLGDFSRSAAIGAVILAVLLLAAWLVFRRRSRQPG